MKKLLLALFLALPVPAWATDSFGHVVTSCGAETYKVGNSGPMTVLATGELCSTASGGGGNTTVDIDQTTPGTTNGVVVNPGGAVGEVQASPTANTILDRLKTIADKIVLGTITLGQTASTSSVSFVSANNEPNIGVPGNTVCATDTGSCTINALLQRLAQRLTSILTGPVPVTVGASTTGGCTLGHTLSAASTNSTSVTAAASTLCWVNAVNTTATIYYLKLYNKASAPTCNSDNVVQTMPIPPQGAAGGAGGFAPTFGAFGGAFSLGIGFCLTAGIADNDNANAATGVAINYGTK